MSHHPLANFQIQKCYLNEPKFNGVYARNHLPEIKDWAYVISLDEYESRGTHWIDLYVNGNTSIQTYNSVMCGYFCTGFIDSMLKGKSLLDYTNLFSPNGYEKNGKMRLKYIQ